MTRLELRGIRLTTRHTDGRRFSLSIPELSGASGDRIALVGESGAGKTTVLEVLALIRAHSQAVVFQLTHGATCVDFGNALRQGQRDRLAGFRARYIGYVPQSGGLLPFLSARENARITVRAAGVPMTDALRERLEGVTERLGLCGHLGKRRGQLSGGERKRVAIARALAMPRRLLLADEPTSGLDPDSASAAMEALSHFGTADGSICIIATHDMALAREHGFRVHRVRRDPQADGWSILDPTPLFVPAPIPPFAPDAGSAAARGRMAPCA